jgi:putative transposase
MKGTVSPGTGRRYPLTMICATWRVPRSSLYVTVTAPPAGPPPGKRGPKTPTTDAAVVAAIREVLAATPFHGEGYRKVRARLAHRGLPDPAHDGRITTDAPDIMGGTDATRFYTEQDGWCWFFGAIDHGIDELLGWHVVKLGDRWAAWEPIRQGVRHAFGDFRKDVARGLAIRCDWGPQYIADAWINEVKWLGITISPSYVGEPECNGVIERFMRTLKEQCVYLPRFQTLEEARQVIAAFIARYNHEWLIERLGYRTPAQARAEGWRAAA